MDDIEILLIHILTRIGDSSLSEDEKSDLYVRLEIGLHSLVWPILLSYIPKSKLDEIILINNRLTVDQYTELIGIALKNKSSMNELYSEMKGALEEVQELVEKSLQKPQLQMSE